MPKATLSVDRTQVLAFRRRVGALTARLPKGKESLRTAAWAGLQDSMPRAALLSINARVEATEPESLWDPSLVQIWGPRFSVYVVAAADRAIFTLGRVPDDPRVRKVAKDLAARLDAFLDGRSMSFGEAGRALGEHPNRLRYAATTGTVVIHWDGARQPTIQIVPPPEADPSDARKELARRYLHIFGPSTAESFAGWAGIKGPIAAATFDELEGSLTPVTTPFGASWILAKDEEAIIADPQSTTQVRLLPSGDSYYLLHGDDRGLLVPKAEDRQLLWTSRVWPGAILANGEIVGTWRRSKNKLTIDLWKRLPGELRNRVEAEATALPLPNLGGPISVRWNR